MLASGGLHNIWDLVLGKDREYKKLAQRVSLFFAFLILLFILV